MKRASPLPEDTCLVKKHKELEKLVNLLDCSVCLRRLRPNPKGIFSCSNGHYTCPDCKTRLLTQHGVYSLSCPTCRIKLTDNKNILAQALLEIEFADVPVLCKYEPACSFSEFLPGLVTHELFCWSRDSVCPASLTRVCQWRGPINQLADHIKKTDCCRLVIDCKDRSIDQSNMVSFRGRLNDRVGTSLFEDRQNQGLKPVVLLSSNIFKMFLFLQV